MDNTTQNAEQNEPAVVKYDGPKAVGFLREASRYFRCRSTGGEDSAHWSNVYNADACLRIAVEYQDMLDALRQWKYAQDNKDAVEMVNAQISRDLAIAKATGGQRCANG